MSSDLDCLFKNLKKINKHLADGSIYLFRGHQDSSYHIQPTIFRLENKSEYDVFSYIMTKHYDEFVGMKPLEVLAKMQHLGVATRLLDLTQNPLVGLFFIVDSFHAKSKNINKDSSSESNEFIEKKGRNKKKGELQIFKYEEKDLKKYDSDTVKLLSCLPLLKEEEKKQLLVDAVNEYMLDVSIKNFFYKTFAEFDCCNASQEIIEFVKEYYYLNERFSTKNGVLYVLKFIGNPVIIDPTNDVWFLKKIKDNQIKLEFFVKKFDNTHVGWNFDISKYEVIVVCSLKNEIEVKPPFKMIFRFDPLEDEKVIFRIKEISYIKYDDVTCENEDDEYLPDYDALLAYGFESLFSQSKDYDGYRSKAMEELHYKVKGFYPEFRRCAKPLDIINGTYVYPFVNTDRMRAQQGLFAIYGLSQYWNFKKYLKYIKSKNICFSQAVRIFLKNDITTLTRTNIRINEMEESIYGVKRIPINTNSFPELRRSLRKLGIDKESLGCSIETTYKKLIES